MVTVAVVIATYRRPGDLARCLDALAVQTVAPDEVVVVDASPDDITRHLVATRPGVTYLRNEAGMGTLPTSRAIAVNHTSCDVVAFLDDDSVPVHGWLAALAEAYADHRVGAVGGRVVNSAEEAATADPARIGALLPDGRLTGNFAADPGGNIKVSHLMGANMSYRRSVIRAVGGIHECYPGTSAREDSDLGLRMTLAGYDVMFAPAAAVDHIAGEYAKGRRFDRRYQFYTQRNHVVLLSRVFGLRSGYLRRYPATAFREMATDLRASVGGSRSPARRLHGLLGGLARSGAKVAGLGAGVAAAIRLRAQNGPGGAAGVDAPLSERG